MERIIYRLPKDMSAHDRDMILQRIEKVLKEFFKEYELVTVADSDELEERVLGAKSAGRPFLYAITAAGTGNAIVGKGIEGFDMEGTDDPDWIERNLRTNLKDTFTRLLFTFASCTAVQNP